MPLRALSAPANIDAADGALPTASTACSCDCSRAELCATSHPPRPTGCAAPSASARRHNFPHIIAARLPWEICSLDTASSLDGPVLDLMESLPRLQQRVCRPFGKAQSPTQTSSEPTSVLLIV